jgi:uncharacterized membrane protein
MFGTMFEWLFSCMVITVKGFIGGILLMSMLIFFSLIVAVISYATSTVYRKNYHKSKPKYKGDPIIIQGGKKDE